MRIIISPAKKMKVDTDSLPPTALPAFLSDTQTIKEILQSMTETQLKSLWKCNDSIAQQNIERLKRMDLQKNLTPAILSYEGIQYQYMAPSVFEYGHFSYIQEHLRILSGFYGLLRPFDGVTPYRLEMQAKLAIEEYPDLYYFWGNKLAHALAAECDFILNLASKEYSKSVLPHLPKTVHVLTCTFGEWNGIKVIEKATQCKMARGQMVRWLSEYGITSSEDIKQFSDLGYRFQKDLSTQSNFIFVKEVD